MDLAEKIKGKNIIIIYGAGDYGRVLFEYMSDNPDFFEKNILMATSSKTEEKIYGMEIFQIDDLKKYSGESLVIVSASKEKHPQMIGKLLAIGFENYYIMTETLYSYMKRTNDRFRNMEQIKTLFQKQAGYLQEILWGMNFNRVIENSKWLTDKKIKAGGAACGYHYFYTLYKILESGKFKEILDIGLGQTSKMIEQYVKYDAAARHTIVENDRDWIDFILPELKLEHSDIVQLDCKMIKRNDADVRVYENFAEKINKRYDLISIDGPVGYDMTTYSRIDILDILPDGLKTSWIILIDDTDRAGEDNMANDILRILSQNNIQFSSCSYQEQKRFTIIASSDNKFFLTL